MAKVPRSLAGLNVAITGGARGIGRATAKALFAQGARVALGDIEQPLAEQTASELGAGAVGLTLDVTDRGSFTAFLDEVETAAGSARRADQQRRDHAARPARVRDGRDRGADHRHQRPRRDHRLEARDRAVPPAPPRPHRRDRLGGRKDRLRQRRHLLCEQARRRRDRRVAAPGAPRHRDRRLGRDAGGVNTELGSGLGAARAFKTVEPEDVAEAIVEALQTNRFDVFVPKSLGATIRSGNVLRASSWSGSAAR